MISNRQDENYLRALLAAGMTPEEIMSSQPMPSDGAKNELAQMLAPLNSNMPPQNQMKTFDEFTQAPIQRGTGYMTGSDGSRITFGEQTTNAPMVPRETRNPASNMPVYGSGNGGTRQLSGEAPQETDIDYSRPKIEIPGMGRGYYSKDGLSAYVSGPNGVSKVLLGYNAEKSDQLNQRELERRKTEASIAQTQEQTAASLASRSRKESTEMVPGAGVAQAVLEKQFGKAPDGKRWLQDGKLEDMPGGTKEQDAKSVIEILNLAEPLVKNSTGSYGGKGLDMAAQAIGLSTQGAEAAAQLKVLEGALVSKMPKMSGPQSDKDVLLYRQMAAQIGDDTIPTPRKLAAMKTLRDLNAKYDTPAAPTSGPSAADLEFTARKHGITVTEVKKRLGIQ